MSRQETAARAADLAITFTGGKAGHEAVATFTATLNTAAAANETAELIDEGAGSESTPATRTTNGYVFNNVKFTEPGQSAARVFRITNIRANVTVLSGPAASVKIAVSGSTSSPVRLSNAKQVVAQVGSEPTAK